MHIYINKYTHPIQTTMRSTATRTCNQNHDLEVRTCVGSFLRALILKCVMYAVLCR